MAGSSPRVQSERFAELADESGETRLGRFLYATGFQTRFAPLLDGQIATQAENVFCPDATCAASAGTIVYEGDAPGIVAGVTQIYLQLNVTGPQAATIRGLQQLPILLFGFRTFVYFLVTL